MAAMKNRKPDRSRLLYDELFSARDRSSTIEILSSGLHIVTQNATELLEDAKILHDRGRHTRADFITATADEEMAKAYILLDMCRLDFRNKESLLRLLCKAFYSHVIKYAYNQVVRQFHLSERDRIDEERVQVIFNNAVVEWFPAHTVEDGEPDMPHHTVFSRDMNLYVDFVGYDQAWWLPSRKLTLNSKYEFQDSMKAVEVLSYTKDKELFEPQALDALNSVFRLQLISDRTTKAELLGLYSGVGESLRNTLKLPLDIYRKSALVEWPLYYLLQKNS